MGPPPGRSFLLMGNGLQGPLLAVRVTLEDFSSLAVGVLGSASFLGFAIGRVFGPHVVHRAGHFRTSTATVAVANSLRIAQTVSNTDPLPHEQPEGSVEAAATQTEPDATSETDDKKNG